MAILFNFSHFISFLKKKVNANLLIILLLFIVLTQVFWRYFLEQQYVSSSRIYCGFDTHSDGLLIGGIIAIMVYHNYNKTIKLLSKLSLLAVIYFTWVLLFQSGELFVHTSIGLLFTNILSASIILYIVQKQQSCVVKFLEWKPLAFLGTVSYGFYLWHYPVVKIMLYSGYDLFGSFFGSFEHVKYMIVLCTFCITLCLTLFSWYVIEKTFLNLKSKKI